MEKEQENWLKPDEKKEAKGFTLEDFENLCKMIWDAPPEPEIIGECVMLHPKPHRAFIVKEPRPDQKICYPAVTQKESNSRNN